MVELMSMKIVASNQGHHMLSFERGEEVISLLIDFAKTLDLQAGFFCGIGAVEAVTLSFYNTETKEYEDLALELPMEIASLNGNISMLDDEPFVHMHGAFADNNMEMRGGHVKRLVVSGTCEVSFVSMPGRVNRTYDPATGLNLME